jgi:integrase
MAKTPNPVALYPGLLEFPNLAISDYPDLQSFLSAGPDWRMAHWRWGYEFLSYIGRNKSEHTFGRFRNETERFLLWVFLYKDKPMDQLRKADILEYADFCWQPPVSWIGLVNHEKFVRQAGFYHQNPQWSPFRLKLAKGSQSSEPANKKKYKPSQQTLSAMFTSVIALYKYLMNEEVLYGNPAQIAKKDCRYFIKDAQIKDVRRLTEQQWLYVIEIAEKLANDDSNHERSLFIICALKALFLRISELSERPNWSPTMSHFWQDSDNNWWLKVYGKGRKIRDITVPDSFLPYLKRYRSQRDLPALPFIGDNSPIVEKIRGQGGMTARQLTRIVQTVFDEAYSAMKAKEGEDKALKLKEASTHWLRHTGASMEVERGRALKDLSEDLGHASMSTTDTIYVQSEAKKRAESGKSRKI